MLGNISEGRQSDEIMNMREFRFEQRNEENTKEDDKTWKSIVQFFAACNQIKNWFVMIRIGLLQC